MRVVVDPDVCEANGVCEGLAPDVFELDDDDVLHIKLRNPPPELREAVLRAVDSCPKQALSISDE